MLRISQTSVSFILRGAVVGLATIAASTTVQAQTSASLGVYGARHGTGAEASVMVTERAGLFVRAEGPLATERAAWLGGRLNMLSESDGSLYLAPMVGAHYCFGVELSGTGSGCDLRAEWKPAAALMAGGEFPLGNSSVSLGTEAGYRFVDAGLRSRWTFGAMLRYRFWHPR